jgi:hypothetical protein
MRLKSWTILVVDDATGTGAGTLACLNEARGPRCGMTIVVSRRKGITFSTLRVKIYLEWM